jgi:hypothetical protein
MANLSIGDFPLRRMASGLPAIWPRFRGDFTHGAVSDHRETYLAILIPHSARCSRCLLAMPEVRLYIDAVLDAELATVSRPSIVNGSIASAL